jgi:hypothetical protein
MVQTGEISFASRIAFNIKMDDAKTRILEELEQRFRFKVIQKHNERYQDSMISKLNNNPHLISVRTNGNPYLLYLTRMNFVNQCVFIDKKVQQGYFLPRIILTKFRFDDDLFKEGTLMDGEMVKDRDGHWIFILSDLIGYKGIYLDNLNAVKRLNLLYTIFECQFKYDEYDVCNFQIKKQFTYDKLEHIITDFIPKLPYTCRGIYFKPLFLKFKDILANFDDSLIQKVMRRKYKSVGNFLLLEDTEKLLTNESHKPVPRVPSFTNAQDMKAMKYFYIKKTNQPDVYEMCDEHNISQGNACVPTLKVSKMMRGLFADKNVTDKLFMKCEFSEKFEKYIPVSVKT